MSERFLFLLPGLLAAQAALVSWVGMVERLPAVPQLSNLPSRLGDWNKIQETPVADDVATLLRADRLLERAYVDQVDGWPADLFVAWFQSQRGGASQPHSPQVCLPAAGWTPETAGPVTLRTPDGAFEVERYVIRNGAGARAVVLYWYQTPRHVLGSEWGAKFWVVADALRDRRTDTSLVRILIYVGNRSVDGASRAAVRFAGAVEPGLRGIFPPLAD